MVALGNNLATWLAACAFFVWAFDFVKGKGYKSLNLADLKGQLPLFIGILLGGGALFGLSYMLGLALAAQILPFALGLAAACIVCSFKFESKSRALLLLGSAVVAFISIAPADNQSYIFSGLVAYLVGILSWKLCSNFLNPGKVILSDVAPAVLFIAGQVFVGTAYSGEAMHRAADLVNSAFIASTLINWFQRPFRADDNFLLKRFILTATGGLIFLILVTKVILAPQYAPLAVLIAAGFAFSYALDGQGTKPGTTSEEGSLDLIRNVLLIGIITLIATRLYGNLGLIVVAATASVSFFRQAPAIAALFVAARALEQSFDITYVANVTGINLMHPYVTAAQYFGFFTVVALMLLLKEGRGRNFETIAMAAVAVIGPAMVNYFLHGEASASYLVALTVAGVLVSILGQKFFYEQEGLCASLMLVATQASAIGLLTAELIEIGNSTSNPERLKVVYCLAGAMAIFMIVSLLRSKKAGAGTDGGTPAQEAVAVAGD
jgi:hypothetical protein